MSLEDEWRASITRGAHRLLDRVEAGEDYAMLRERYLMLALDWLRDHGIDATPTLVMTIIEGEIAMARIERQFRERHPVPLPNEGARP